MQSDHIYDLFSMIMMSTVIESLNYFRFRSVYKLCYYLCVPLFVIATPDTHTYIWKINRNICINYDWHKPNQMCAKTGCFNFSNEVDISSLQTIYTCLARSLKLILASVRSLRERPRNLNAIRDFISTIATVKCDETHWVHVCERRRRWRQRRN